MKWEKEKPTEPGYYWMKCKGWWCENANIVSVDEDMCGYYSDDLYEHVDSEEWKGAEWAGPIPEPGDYTAL